MLYPLTLNSDDQSALAQFGKWKSNTWVHWDALAKILYGVYRSKVMLNKKERGWGSERDGEEEE